MSAVFTNEQCKIIAAAVLPDIRAYVKEHQAEYQEWLKKYESKEPPVEIGA